ncbi:hypothetical protein [Thiohalocapsa sp. ML1]|jgi:hypothetical protein|uniref:hypothetical protein n=1 Tax=Thiohalocapsa sp. ML1 TaxID=1431688 RepID=UPI0007323B30|nr:hypothetical protein [Thiohalocapsa sp. ML1]
MGIDRRGAPPRHRVWPPARAGLLAGLLAVGALSGAAAAPDQAKEPAPVVRPPLVDKWLPNDWWTPEQVVSGRLNDDDYDDLAVVVQRRIEAPEDPKFPRGSRALFVLYGTADGRWRRGELVPGLLPCGECSSALSGTIGAALFDLRITPDGVLELGWVARDRGTKAVRLTIGWDRTFRALGLYVDEVQLLRPRGGRSRVRRDYRAGRMWVDGVAEDMPARFIPIGEVSASQY